jgi:hypothetical protein
LFGFCVIEHSERTRRGYHLFGALGSILQFRLAVVISCAAATEVSVRS